MYLKKLAICAMMIISMLLSIPAQGAYIDIDNENVANKLDILEQLDIVSGYEDATFRPDSTVTRGEFAISAAKLLALEPSTTNGYFSDIDSEAEYFGYVNALADIGAINGTGSSAFNPDREITYTEAVKILLSAMGYADYCNFEGGYPDGYIKTASRLDLGYASQLPLTRAQLVTLLYQAMEIPVMKLTQVEGGDAIYTATDIRAMEEYLDLVRFEGILTYDGNTSIDGSETGILPYIIVDGERIELGGQECTEYLGYEVTVFALKDKNADTYTLKAIAPVPGENSSVTIDAKDITSVSGGEIIKAVEGRDNEKYRLESAAVIYNGCYRQSYDDELLKPEEGFIKLVDNDDDGKYEVVMVYQTTDDVTEGVNISNESLYFKNYGLMELREKDIFIYIDGKRKELSDMSTGYAVSIAIGEDERITIWASTAKVSDILKSYDEESITVGDKTYPISKQFDFEKAALRVGNNYTAYISYFGKVVDVEYSSKNESYGWLMGLSYDNPDVLSQDMKFKMLLDDGTIERMPVAENLIVNDKKIKFDKKNLIEKGLMDALGKGIQQLLKFTTDEEGTILKLYTAQDMTEYGICDDAFSLDKSVRNTDTRMYRYNIGINYHIGATTKIFYLPLENEINKADASDYAAGTLSAFSTDINYSNFDIYDTRPDRTAGVLVIRRTIEQPGINARLTDALMKRTVGVITKSVVVNDGDEDAVEVTMLTAGKELTFKTQSADLHNSTQDSWAYSQTLASELKKGDVILYSVNEKNQIRDFTILLRGDEITGRFYERIPSNIMIDEYNDVALTPLHTVFGEVSDINSTTYSINVSKAYGDAPAAKEMRHLMATASAQVYIMDYNEGEFRVGELSDIIKGDIVFMRAYSYVPQQIVIYRGEPR